MSRISSAVFMIRDQCKRLIDPIALGEGKMFILEEINQKLRQARLVSGIRNEVKRHGKFLKTILIFNVCKLHLKKC